MSLPDPWAPVAKEPSNWVSDLVILNEDRLHIICTETLDFNIRLEGATRPPWTPVS